MDNAAFISLIQLYAFFFTVKAPDHSSTSKCKKYVIIIFLNYHNNNYYFLLYNNVIINIICFEFIKK